MIQAATANGQDRPDLPELESVETRDTGALPALLVFGAFSLWMTALVIWGCVRYYRFLPPPAKAMGGVIVACMLWFLLRLLFAYTSFRTGRGGITLRGPIRRAFLQWPELTSASTSKGRNALVLQTSRTKVRISPRGFGGSSGAGDCILASSWQHLRRLGKADEIELTDGAKSLWEPIPDDVPREIEWGKPSRTNLVGLVACSLLFPGVLVALWLAGAETIPGILMLSVLSFGLIVLFTRVLIPTAKRTASQVAVRDDGLEARTALGKTYLPWSQVTAAWWLGWNLVIRSANPCNEVWVPYTLGSKESETLILSLIRRLRTSGTPQAVPMPLLISRSPEALNKTAWSGPQLRAMQQAFLNTLEEPVRKRIRRLYGLVVASFFVGMAMGAAITFAELPGRVSKLLFAGPDTRFFVPASSIPVAVPVMIFCIVFVSWLAERMATRLAGPYKEVLQEFGKVGTGRATRILLYVFAAIGAAGVLTLPLFVDCYTRFTDKGVAVNRFLSFGEEFYAWDDVSAVQVLTRTVSDHGRLRRDDSYRILFTDGSSWSADESNCVAKPAIRQAVEFAARRSGKAAG